ncbi:MAG: zinc-ribbon domain-containing protein [Bacilli bacterium]|nr:zinc-ribbon domain-containing protein [Bacilli bacterium]
MKYTNNVENHKYSTFAKIMRFLGIIILVAGIVLIVRGLMDLQSSFISLFIGIPITFVGGVFISFGFMKKFNQYTASQTAPVKKDVTNYMLDGTREELGETTRTIFDSVNDHRESNKTKRCPKCGELNDADAKFCDNCGASLVKVCPKCGTENDINARYCDNCGEKLY